MKASPYSDDCSPIFLRPLRAAASTLCLNPTGVYIALTFFCVHDGTPSTIVLIFLPESLLL